MRGSRLSEARRHPPGNADACAWNVMAGTDEGGVGGQGRALSHELGVPTENQFRRVSYPETQRTRMTRRQCGTRSVLQRLTPAVQTRSDFLQPPPLRTVFPEPCKSSATPS